MNSEIADLRAHAAEAAVAAAAVVDYCFVAAAVFVAADDAFGPFLTTNNGYFLQSKRSSNVQLVGKTTVTERGMRRK